jgi:hypothetical protein
VQPVLGHAHRDQRQLRDLVPPRLRHLNQLRRPEHMRAREAPLRPILDDLVDLIGRKQPPVPTLMAGLTAAPSTRTLPARTRWHRRRIPRRRQGRVPRTPIQPPLQLSHPSLKTLIRLDQLTDPQQQRDRPLAIAIKGRLRLNPLHAKRFANSIRVPSPG